MDIDTYSISQERYLPTLSELVPFLHSMYPIVTYIPNHKKMEYKKLISISYRYNYFMFTYTVHMLYA